MSASTPQPPGTTRIVQGHPTGSEPSINKGGQNGSPKPDGRSAQADDTLPAGGADAGAGPDDPGRGGD
jgi:hypothetical protein